MRTLLFHGVAAALVVLSLATARLGPLAEAVPEWLLLYGVGFALLVVPVVWKRRRPARPGLRIAAIVLWALAIRAPLLQSDASLSDDVHRYVWEGRVVADGGDPWDHSPDSVEVLRLVPFAPEWESINHKHLPALYPAGAQWFFALVTVQGADVSTMRRALVGVDLLLIVFLGLLLVETRRRLEWLVLYAWHPLVAVEVASSGHYEPLAMLPMVVGLLMLARKGEAAAWLSFGGALATKYVGALPAFFVAIRRLRQHRWAAAIGGPVLAVGVLVLLSLPFSLDGTAPIGSLGDYTAHWAHNASLHALLTPHFGFHPARYVLGGVMVLWLLWVASRDWAPSKAFLAVFVGLIYCSPVVHPWYGLWVIVLLPMYPGVTLAFLSGLLPLSYLCWTSQQAGGPWVAPAWVPWVEYGLPLLLVVPERMWRRAGRRPTPD